MFLNIKVKNIQLIEVAEKSYDMINFNPKHMMSESIINFSFSNYPHS